MGVILSRRDTEITISAGSGATGWKSHCSGWFLGLAKKQKLKKKEKKPSRTGFWGDDQNIKKTSWDWKIPLHLLPLHTLKDRDSEEHNDGGFSIPPPHVVRSVRSRRKLFGPFWLCSTVSHLYSFLNSKCRHLKLQSFIHWSDCETRRWFEVLTVTSPNGI